VQSGGLAASGPVDGLTGVAIAPNLWSRQGRMDDAVMPIPLTAPKHQRSHGLASVSFARLDGATRLGRLRQQGSAKAILPHIHRDVPEVVFLNTSGGLTGGDRLTYAVDLGHGTRAVATTQTAERAYAAGGGQACVHNSFRIGAGGHLDWLPQETILFNGSAVTRETVVDLDADATCLLLEAVILGRHAMGETVTHVDFQDRRIIRQSGRLVHLEPTTLCNRTVSGDRTALLGPARAYASIVALGPDYPDKLGTLRVVLDEAGVTAGASVVSGKLCLRMLAVDALAMRRQIVRALAVLRSNVFPPRVWQN
jgi:urease accessory protein